MLDKTGFDLWADGYDKAVGLSDESDNYPFAGYKRVLGSIFSACLAYVRPNGMPPRILDVGFGTGTLTSKLYEQGCEIWGQDFSPKMLEIAQRKMPDARLFQGDFSDGLLPELKRERYDCIISTYALHHLTDSQKVSFIQELLGLLVPGGRLFIGDVAFRTREQLDACRAKVGEGWDFDEIYFVYEEFARFFPGLEFEEMSHCAGVLCFRA